MLSFPAVLPVMFIISASALKCYEGMFLQLILKTICKNNKKIKGSRGVVNGEDSTNFVENLCDDNMTYCFESYNSNLTEVTASCQSMGTDQKLLDVCKMNGKCKERSDIDVTVCCCTSDLCNLQSDLKPTSEIPNEITNSNSTILTTSRLVELNETIGLEAEFNGTIVELDN
uniref:Activin types I and II receptor domain-containing protein n=2 Tax=Caenorhabditis japonica TaxID=281687 RepID=A0A8R1I0U5_CAEJA